MSDGTLVTVLSASALLTGVAGTACVLLRVPRSTERLRLSLLLAFATVAIGGLLGVLPLGLPIGVAGAVALFGLLAAQVNSVFTTWLLAAREHRTDVVLAEAQRLRALADGAEARAGRGDGTGGELERLRRRDARMLEVQRLVGERTQGLEERVARLQQTIAAKDHFVASLTHELRTPLTSIRSFSEILLEPDGPDEATRGEFLNIILKETARLGRMVGTVLDLARIDNGEFRLELSDFDVRDVVRDSVDALRASALERSVRLDAQLGETPLGVFADRDRIQQVLVNLLSNAVKFSPEGGRVVIDARGDSERVTVCVSDEGEGIAPEDVDRVFERWYQAGSARSRAGGTGIGLAVCREIADAHQGTVCAQRAPGGGARFVFELPTTPSTGADLLPGDESVTGPAVELRTARHAPRVRLQARRTAAPHPRDRRSD